MCWFPAIRLRLTGGCTIGSGAVSDHTRFTSNRLRYNAKQFLSLEPCAHFKVFKICGGNTLQQAKENKQTTKTYPCEFDE